MPLITEEAKAVFDLSQIARGHLLWGRHCTWQEGKAGFVTSATEGQLTVQYHPGIGNVTNHFVIPVSEVAAGWWEIRWSKDLSGVQGYGIAEDSVEGEGESETEGGESGDTGGTDL